jgi:hypothetical protein
MHYEPIFENENAGFKLCYKVGCCVSWIQNRFYLRTLLLTPIPNFIYTTSVVAEIKQKERWTSLLMRLCFASFS